MKLADILIELVGGIFKLLFELIVMIYDGCSRKQPLHSAKLTNPTAILSKRNRGLSMGSPTKNLSLKDSYQHALVVASSGYGKSTTVAINSLMNLVGSGSVVALDPAQELYKKTAGWYHQNGYRIIRLDFSDRNGNWSDGWNPLPLHPDHVQGFMQTLIETEAGTGKDPFWNLQAGLLLTTIAKTLYALPPEYRTMATVLDILNIYAGKPKQAEAFISQYADEATWLEFLAFASNDSANTKSGIIASAKAVLTVFNQPGIRRMTSYPTFSVEDITHTPTIVYVQTNAASIAEFKLPIALFFNELINGILASDPDDPNRLPLHILCDEIGLYRIPILPTAITQLRKFRCSLTLMVQSRQQIFDRYGNEMGSTIVANTKSKLYMAGQDMHLVREIEAMSGTTFREDTEGNKRIAPVLTADEARSINENSALFLYGHLRPAVVKLTPYYTHKRTKRLTDIPPPASTRTLPKELPPIFPITQFIKPNSHEA